MVVNQVNIVGIAELVDAENDSPVARYPDAPLTPAASRQFVQTVTRKPPHILKRLTVIQHFQDISYPPYG